MSKDYTGTYWYFPDNDSYFRVIGFNAALMPRGWDVESTNSIYRNSRRYILESNFQGCTQVTDSEKIAEIKLRLMK
jgi:hypothetical protein